MTIQFLSRLLSKRSNQSQSSSSSVPCSQILFDLNSNEMSNRIFSDPSSNTKIISGISVNQSGRESGAPLVNVIRESTNSKNQLILDVEKTGLGTPGSYWGLRVQPISYPSNISGAIIKLTIQIEFDGTISLPRMLIKICDGMSCSERLLKTEITQQTITIYHVAHQNAKKIFVDINIGEWRYTKFSSVGKIIITNMSLEVENHIEMNNEVHSHLFTSKELNIGEIKFPYDLQNLKKNAYLDRLSLTFPEKIHCFYHYNPEMQALSYLLNPEESAIDIGANYGTYTAFLSKYAKSVWAFEPNPDVFPYLVRNASLYQNVFCFPVVLGDSHNDVKLFLPKHRVDSLLESGGGSIASKEIEKQGVENFDEYRVPQQVLDSMMPKDVGLIKIDVEGAELFVLKGSEQIIKKYYPSIIIEIFDQWTDTCDETLEFLMKHDYEIFFYCEPKTCFMPIKQFNFDIYYNYFIGYPQKKTIFQYTQNFLCINNKRKNILKNFRDQFVLRSPMDSQQQLRPQ